MGQGDYSMRSNEDMVLLLDELDLAYATWRAMVEDMQHLNARSGPFANATTEMVNVADNIFKYKNSVQFVEDVRKSQQAQRKAKQP